MAFLIAFTSVVVVSFVTSAPVKNNVTVPYSGEDKENTIARSHATKVTTDTEVPEVTIFKTDKRSDREKFFEAVRSARKLWNGDYMYQRDIRITRPQLAQIYGVDTSKDETYYAWPNATVPFSFGRKVLDFARDIRDAMRHWERETCVRFVETTENTVDTDQVRFVQSRW